LVKKEKRKIPRKALEPLMQMCEWESKEMEKPAADIFKRYLELMAKYDDYFFSKPWPKKYDHDEATTFTDEDLEFLRESGEEFWEKFTVVCLKKNTYSEGFMGYFGMYWTEQAFHKKFIRPSFKPVLEAFEKCAEKHEDARSVLNELKKQFHIKVIHASLIDLLENEHLDETKDLLVARMLELIHTEEDLPPCSNYRCKLKREMLRENRDRNANV